VKTALKQKRGLVFVHTHPWDAGVPEFSKTDDQGEQLLATFLRNRGLAGMHGSLLFGRDRCRGRVLGTDKELCVIAIGSSQRVVFEGETHFFAEESHDRQVRLLRLRGQRRLAQIRVGIVGLGGTGSVVAQQLAYLGVNDFLLLDPDAIDRTNLNRLVGAVASDIEKTKVSVTARQIKKINSNAQVNTVALNILDFEAARLLVEVDIVFCCTDSQASRVVLNQLAYQYFIPCIDVGVSITTIARKVTRVTGRTQLLAPGQACLTCQELLDANIIRQEFMTPEQRAQDPYFLGEGEPQPAVISLNSTMSSLAVTMFLAVVANLPSRARHLVYDALQGKVRPATAAQYPTCIVCSKHGALARGDEWPLPVRQVSGNGVS
jgi:molybdopterin/thiamine biosynthesis adenylyltransferase